MSDEGCPFCQRVAERKSMWENWSAVAFLDAYPVGFGHTLVVPKDHYESLFDAPKTVREAVWMLADEMQGRLAAALGGKIDGWTIGLNDGEAAGQTIAHAHVHVMPRRRGDNPDPRGGVRWVVPERANYWTLPGCS